MCGGQRNTQCLPWLYFLCSSNWIYTLVRGMMVQGVLLLVPRWSVVSRASRLPTYCSLCRQYNFILLPFWSFRGYPFVSSFSFLTMYDGSRHDKISSYLSTRQTNLMSFSPNPFVLHSFYTYLWWCCTLFSWTLRPNSSGVRIHPCRMEWRALRILL